MQGREVLPYIIKKEESNNEINRGMMVEKKNTARNVMISHLKCKQWWTMCGLRDFTLCSVMDIVLWSSLNAWGLLHCVSCQIILHIPCSWSCNLSAWVEWKILRLYRRPWCSTLLGYWNLFYFWDPWIESFQFFLQFWNTYDNET